MAPLVRQPVRHVKDAETQQKFILLRAQGATFARIAQELGVARGTLVNWSRKFQFDINNLRAMELEHLQEQLIATREQRARLLADPWIAEASLARQLPGTIFVQVKEREAAGVVATTDAKNDSAIVIGRTFSDPGAPVYITPLGLANTYPPSIDVRVNIAMPVSRTLSVILKWPFANAEVRSSGYDAHIQKLFSLIEPSG